MKRKNIISYLEKIQKETEEYSEKKFVSNILECFSIGLSNKKIIEVSKAEMERDKKCINLYQDDGDVGKYYKFCFNMSKFVYQNLEENKC